MGKKKFVVTIVLAFSIFFVFFSCIELEKDYLGDYLKKYPKYASNLPLENRLFTATNSFDVPPLELTSALFEQDGSPPQAVLQQAGGISEAVEYTWLTHYIRYELDKDSTAFYGDYSNQGFFKKPVRNFYIGIKFSKTPDKQRMAIIYQKRIIYISKKLDAEDYRKEEASHSASPPSEPAFYIDFNRNYTFVHRFTTRHVSVYFYVSKNYSVPLQRICANKDVNQEMRSLLLNRIRVFNDLNNDLKLCRIDFVVDFQEDFRSEKPIFKAEIDFSVSTYFYGWEEEDLLLDGNSFYLQKDRTYLTAMSKEFLAKRVFSAFYWPDTD